MPGGIVSVATAGDTSNPHPHLHSIISAGAWDKTSGEFFPWPFCLRAELLTELFRRQVLVAWPWINDIVGRDWALPLSSMRSPGRCVLNPQFLRWLSMPRMKRQPISIDILVSALSRATR